MSPKQRFRIFMRDDFRCRYCGARSSEAKLHIDHVHPRSKGGSDEDENLVTACAGCNLGKSAALLPVAPEFTIIDLAKRLEPLLQSYHETRGIDRQAASHARGKIYDLGVTIHQLAGLSGLSAVYEWLEDQYIDTFVGHLDASWDGIGDWHY